MTHEAWAHDAQGNIDAKLGTGWRVALAPGGALIRIEYAEREDEAGLWQERSLQVVMSSTQLRELAEALQQTADILEAPALKPTKQ